MTTPLLLADLRRDEGLRLKAYPDPKSGGRPYTIGYGHASSAVKLGDSVTPARAVQLLEADLLGAESQLSKAIPWWLDLDDVRQDAMAELGFNLGVHKLTGEFQHTLAAIQHGDFQTAGAHLATSQWARDVGPGRAGRIVTMIETGARALAKEAT